MRTTGITSFRVVLARRVGMLIRTVLSSDTMTQRMDEDTGFIARLTSEDTPAQVDPEPEIPPIEGYYTFQSINVLGVDFLEVTASNDFGDYAGNTRDL